MPPSRLLRVSEFCREQKPRTIAVSLEILRTSRRRSRRIPTRVVFDPEASIFVSTDLLVALSLQVGSVALLKSDCSLVNGVPVTLLVSDENKEREDSPSEVADSYFVQVPPTIAASIGVNDLIATKPRCWIQSYHESLVEADTVSVRPIGRPVPQSWSDIPNTVPNLSSSNTSRMIAQSSLISVLDDSWDLFVFEVVHIQSNQRYAEMALTTNKTMWTLEASPVEGPVRRLPPLSLAISFHASLRLQENESLNVDAAATRIQEIAHPSIPEIRNILVIPTNAPVTQRILHVEGTEDNHINACIQSAADTLGMRYVPIRGLAAHAHASDVSVSTGSLADQLAGCQVALRHAQECAPCVLHLCDVDQEWPQDDEPMRHMQQQRLWTTLVDLLARGEYSVVARRVDNSDSFLSTHTPSVLVVLSTTEPLSAGPLMHNLIFESPIIRPPDELYARHLWKDDSSFDQVFSTYLAGRSAQDISHFQRYWTHCGSTCDNMEIFDEFCRQVDAKQRKSTPHIPTVQWADVGGLANVRCEIMDAIELPLKHPDLFPNGGRSGILLYGPPGTGKTLVAKAVATECDLPFLSVKGPELLGSYVGESEANVRATFAAARKAATQGRTTAASILFFDELDSLAPRRGGAGDNGGVMDRVVAMLLTELDGSSSSSSSSSDGAVFTIGATNRPDLLDPSLLRPGRLDRLVYLGMATKTQDRAQILAALIRKFRLDTQDPAELAHQVVDSMPPNLTGADFSAIASNALRRSLERVCRMADDELERRRLDDNEQTLDNVLDEWSTECLVPVVTSEDLIEASKNVIPSVSEKQLADYERLRDQFSS